MRRAPHQPAKSNPFLEATEKTSRKLIAKWDRTYLVDEITYPFPVSTRGRWRTKTLKAKARGITIRPGKMIATVILADQTKRQFSIDGDHFAAFREGHKLTLRSWTVIQSAMHELARDWTAANEYIGISSKQPMLAGMFPATT